MHKVICDILHRFNFSTFCRLLLHSSGLTPVNNADRALQCISRVFILHFKDVHIAFQGFSYCISRMFILHFKGFHIAFQGCGYCISRMWILHFKDVHIAFQGCGVCILYEIAFAGCRYCIIENCSRVHFLCSWLGADLMMRRESREACWMRVTGSVKAQTRVDDLWPNCVAHKCTQINTIA